MRKFSIFIVVALLTACAVSPTGRPQLKLFPDAEIAQMGAASYQKIKQETPIERSRSINNYVACVSNSITQIVGGSWEVTVFAQDQANAFALPGGKIGVYTGLLNVANGQAQLATVVGHEVAHVLADHGNSRVSTQFATQTAVQLASSVAGGGVGGQLAMAALGAGAQVGVLLPFSRGQEGEADILGLNLMARAGFDPRQSVALWQNMQRQGGSQSSFLSTHPSEGDRIKALQQHMPEALQIYNQARAAGRRPSCG